MKVFIDANLLIYLNVGSTEEVLDLWVRILAGHEPYTSPLVLDEVLWVSRRKYGVSYGDTASFLRDEVLPFTTILPVGVEEYVVASHLLGETRLKPSDALHVGTMKTNGITVIASEDEEFDGITGIRRIWIDDRSSI